MAQHDDSGCRTIIGALWYPTHARDRLKISAGQGSDTSRRPDRDTRKKLSLPFAQAPRSQTDAKTLRAPGNSPTPPPYRRPLRHASNRGTRCDSPRLLQRGVYAAIHANRFDGMPPQCGTGNTRANESKRRERGGREGKRAQTVLRELTKHKEPEFRVQAGPRYPYESNTGYLAHAPTHRPPQIGRPIIYL